MKIGNKNILADEAWCDVLCYVQRSTLDVFFVVYVSNPL